MTSQRRIEANRRNAQRSTGPKTAAGKARVAQNAVTHGLLARETLLPDEDPQALETLAEAMRAELNPVGPHEEFLVEMMVRAFWRLCRVGRVEAGIFAWKHYNILIDRANHEAKSYERRAVPALTDDDDQTPIMDPQKHRQAMAAAEQLSGLRNGPTATIGLTFMRASSALTTLVRYEAAAERTYHRVARELQHLQQTRLGGHVPPSLAPDVTFSGRDDGGPDDPGTAARQADKAEPKDGAAENEGHRPAEGLLTKNAIEDELFA